MATLFFFFEWYCRCLYQSLLQKEYVFEAGGPAGHETAEFVGVIDRLPDFEENAALLEPLNHLTVKHNENLVCRRIVPQLYARLDKNAFHRGGHCNCVL